MENFIINTCLTFKEYFKLILRLRFKSNKIIWDLLWLFLMIIIISFGDFSKKPLDIQNIMSNGFFKIFILILYPISIYYIYIKKFYSKNSLLKEKLVLEFQDNKISYKTHFITNIIENSNIIEIQKINKFIILHFDEDYLIINCLHLTNTEVEKIIEKIKPNG